MYQYNNLYELYANNYEIKSTGLTRVKIVSFEITYCITTYLEIRDSMRNTMYAILFTSVN